MNKTQVNINFLSQVKREPLVSPGRAFAVMGVSDNDEEDMGYFSSIEGVHEFLDQCLLDWVDFEGVIVFYAEDYDPAYDNAGTVRIHTEVKFIDVKRVEMVTKVNMDY